MRRVVLILAVLAAVPVVFMVGLAIYMGMESAEANKRVKAACNAAVVGMSPDEFVALKGAHGVGEVHDGRDRGDEASEGFVIDLYDGSFRERVVCSGRFEGAKLVSTEFIRMD